MSPPDLHVASASAYCAKRGRDPRIEVVLGRVDSLPWRHWTVHEMVSLTALSYSQFARLFSAQIGASPLRYLRARQRQRAAQLLAESTASVDQIRTEVGIGDASHFSRDFRARFGCSAGQYRVSRLFRRQQSRQRC